MSGNFQNDERRDDSKVETQASTDSTLERLVEALMKIDATLNRLNDRLETLERRLDDGQTAKKNKARRDLRYLNEDDFDAPPEGSDYFDAYKKGDDGDDDWNFDDADEWEDVYDCAADVDEWGDGAGTGAKVRRFNDFGQKVGETDDELVWANELKAAENAEKIALEPGTYRVGVDLPSGRYLAKSRGGSAVVRVVCSQWRGVYTLDCDDERLERTKKLETFRLAMKLIDGATMRTDDPIELTYLSPVEPLSSKTPSDD
jgi:hypothetical protein